MHSAYYAFDSWLRTRRAQHESAAQLAARRERLWRTLQSAIAKTPALKHLAEQPLSSFPVQSPLQLREDIGLWNSCGIDHAAAHAAAQSAERGEKALLPHGISAGYSTGTSGTRGLFLASPRERAIYLGQALAKLLPLKHVLGARILLFLRANNSLYNEGGLLSLIYCPLTATATEKQRVAEHVNPTILIAPSHILAELAARRVKLPALTHCFYGAEPMGEAECALITDVLGIRPHPIYQATEGFLAAPCRNGRLHLNEDSLNIEWEPVENTAGHQLIVTDLQRHTQPIIRVRMDDFIERDERPCDCGFAGATIYPVAGRTQDIWRFGQHVLTPRNITELLETHLSAEQEWKVIGSHNSIQLHLAPTIANEAAQRAATALSRLAPVHITELSAQPIVKRRRVEWRIA